MATERYLGNGHIANNSVAGMQEYAFRHPRACTVLRENLVFTITGEIQRQRALQLVQFLAE